MVPRASVEYTGSWSSSKSIFSGKVLIRYWPSLDVWGGWHVLGEHGVEAWQHEQVVCTGGQERESRTRWLAHAQSGKGKFKRYMKHCTTLCTCMHTHTTHTPHTHRHTQAHTDTHRHTHTHTHTQTHIHAHICTQAHTHACRHTHMHTHIRTHACAHTHTHRYTHKRTHTHTHVHTHIRTQANKSTLIHTQGTQTHLLRSFCVRQPLKRTAIVSQISFFVFSSTSLSCNR